MRASGWILGAVLAGLLAFPAAATAAPALKFGFGTLDVTLDAAGLRVCDTPQPANLYVALDAVGRSGAWSLIVQGACDQGWYDSSDLDLTFTGALRQNGDGWAMSGALDGELRYQSPHTADAWDISAWKDAGPARFGVDGQLGER